MRRLREKKSVFTSLKQPVYIGNEINYAGFTINSKNAKIPVNGLGIIAYEDVGRTAKSPLTFTYTPQWYRRVEKIISKICQKWSPGPLGARGGNFRQFWGPKKKWKFRPAPREQFGSKWIPDETSGQAGRLKRMAYGSSSYDLFGKNIDLTCNLQSTCRIL